MQKLLAFFLQRVNSLLFFHAKLLNLHSPVYPHALFSFIFISLLNLCCPQVCLLHHIYRCNMF
uniref:Uncharacterized protein n=1 Tax=Octopus bimaculoides TaxID=37653 RepID=A0A0L8IAN7_OCTBM